MFRPFRAPDREPALVVACDPCKHVAATHYVLGEALDRDPFLLFELRGKTKDQVLAALRSARGAATETTAKKGRRAKAAPEADHHEVPAVTLGKLKALDYDRPREPLPALRFGFDEPVTHGAVLRQLGAPTGWQGEGSPADVFAPLVRAAAVAARRIAMAEPSDAGDAAGGTLASEETAAVTRAPRKRAARRRRA